MGEDDIVELLGKSSQVVTSSQTQTPSCDPPLILRGSGSGDGEGNGPLPQPPPPLYHQQSLFIQEDEMASWLHQPNRQDYLYSQLLYSGVASTHPQSLASLEPPPPPRAQYILAADRPTGHILAERRAENFMNISRQRGNIFLGGVEAVPSNSTLLSSATESIPATHGTESRATVTGGVSRTFAVPGLGPRGKAVAIETAGTQSWGLCKAETEPVQRQPATETDITDERKRKTREETNVENQGTEEARDSTSSKRSRAAIMHKLSERRRRQKINEMMKALQELLPRCTKTDRSSMLDDVIEYVKSLQSQIQMFSMGHVMIPPMMYAGNIQQQYMPHMAMGMNRPPAFIPFPRQAHMAEGVGPVDLFRENEETEQETMSLLLREDKRTKQKMFS